jgi:hypothetical protein
MIGEDWAAWAIRFVLRVRTIIRAALWSVTAVDA